MIAGILAAIAALPELLKYTLELIKLFETKFGPNWKQEVIKITEAFAAVNKAETPEEYKDAAAKVRDAFNGPS